MGGVSHFSGVLGGSVGVTKSVAREWHVRGKERARSNRVCCFYFLNCCLFIFFAAAWTITINWLKLPKCWALKDCFNIWKNTSWNWIVILIRCWADTAENHGQNTSTKYGYCFVVPCFNCSIVHVSLTHLPFFLYLFYFFSFQDNAHLVTEESLDFLDSLLQYDHQERVTAEDAMKHEYFKCIHEDAAARAAKEKTKN